MATIPIFMASDDNYAVGVATTMLSILLKTKAFCEFYILDSGISDLNKEKIQKSVSSFKNCRIEFIDVSRLDLSKFPNLYHFSLSCFLRYYIPELKPDISKAIYTDVDVIFTGDIEKYYQIDLGGGKPLAASPEEIGHELGGKFNHNKRKKDFNIPTEHVYFQSGNLIIDCDYWRKNAITKKLVDLTIKLKDQLICPDLDILNIVFACNYKRLDFRYCASTCRIKSTYNNPELENAYENPFIIHYADCAKPWNFYGGPYCDEYDRVLQLSTFADRMEQRHYYGDVNSGGFSMKEFNIRSEDKILILAPHPDDEVIGCGGLLAKYAHQTDVIVLTDGRYSNPSWTVKKTVETRQKEFKKTMSQAKVNSFDTLMLEDSKLYKHFNEFKKIDFSKYSIIFIPNRDELHPDHKIVYDFLLRCHVNPLTIIASYQVWSPIPNPQYYINIADVIKEKEKFISNYESQQMSLNYISYIRGLNHYQGITKRLEFVEAFDADWFVNLYYERKWYRKIFRKSFKKNELRLYVFGIKIKLKTQKIQLFKIIRPMPNPVSL